MPRIEEIKDTEIKVSVARAKSAVLMARTYISKQPGSTTVPLLKSLIEVGEGFITLAEQITATGVKP